MALNFNGSSDDVSNNSVAAVSGPPATLAAWVRPDVVNAEKRILGCYNSTSNPLFGIEMTSAGKANMQFRNDAGVQSNGTGTTTLSTSAFQHICGTVDSSGISEVFYNGSSEGTGGSVSTTVTLSRTQIGVLNRGTETQWWDGDLAEAALWNVVLDDSEVAALAKGYSPLLVRPGSLVFYAPLVRDVVDRKGLALTVGGTTVSDHPRIIYPSRPRIVSKAAATGGGALTGSSAATSGATGTLTGSGALSGTSAATSGATGTIANGSAGALSGTSTATSGATATLTAIGALVASAPAVSGATGTIRNSTPRTSIMGTAALAPPLAQVWADFEEDSRY